MNEHREIVEQLREIATELRRANSRFLPMALFLGQAAFALFVIMALLSRLVE